MADLDGTYTAYLPCSTKAACEAVLNVTEYPAWWSRSVTTGLKKGLNGKAMVGSTIEVKLDKVTFEYEVRKIDAGKRIDLECAGGSYRGPASWTFAAEKKGTRITFTIALDAHGFLMKALTKTVDVAGIHAKVLNSSLERLAAKVAG